MSLDPVLRRVLDEACKFGAWHCGPGYKPDALRAAEVRWGFRFPPDLEALLRYAAPIGGEFPDWSRPDAAPLQRRFEQVWKGIDVEASGRLRDCGGVSPPPDSAATRPRPRRTAGA